MKLKLMAVVILSTLILAACGAPSTAPIVPTAPPSVLPTVPPSPLEPGDDTNLTGEEAAVANSTNDLAARLNIDPGAVTLVSVEAVDWSNACLGIETPGIMCAMVITPGYRVVLEADGKQYEYHTNADSSAVKLATPLS